MGEHMALKYLVKEPAKKTEQTHLILLLHGYGSNEADLFSLAAQLPGDELIVAARAPITLSDNSYAWYNMNFTGGSAPNHNKEEAEKARLLILKFIDQLTAKYKIHTGSVVLLGFSQGTIMSYSIGLTQPEKVKGIVALSGRILPEIKGKIANNSLLQKLPFFIAHGTKDNVLPINNGRDAKTYMEGLKLKIAYHEYDMAHQILPQELKDINDWLATLLKTK